MKVVERLRIFVSGDPVPQGSKKGYVVGGRAVIVDDNKDELKAWRGRVAAAASVHFKGDRIDEGPVVVLLTFGMPRGSSVRREFPTVRPDLDKLMRAVLDALTEAGVWRDDAQVIDAYPRKRYSDRPGVEIRVGTPR